MNPNTTKTILSSLLPFMTNPATIALVGAGAVALTVYSMFSDDEEAQDNGTKTVPNGAKRLPAPLPRRNPTAPTTVRKPLEAVEATVSKTAEPTVREPLPVTVGEASPHEPEQGIRPNSEDENKEMIRQAMSELGKRSAAARARKKKA